MTWAGLLARLAVLELVSWYLRPHWWDRFGRKRRASRPTSE